MISKVAILLPIYNTNKESLNRALESVHNQSVITSGRIKDYTIYLVNDCSEIDYSEYSKHSNIHLININKHKKVSYALNLALNKANEHGYKWAFIMGGNDVSHLRRFEKQLNLLEKYPDTHIIGTQMNGVNERGEVLFTINCKAYYHRGIDKGLDNFYIASHQTVLYNIYDILELGGYNIHAKGDEDIRLWKIAFNRGYKFRNVNEILYTCIR